MNRILPLNRRHSATFLWLCCCCFLLLFSLGLSWQVNKSVNFFYKFWYSPLNIEQTIKTYAPQNTQGKQDFAQTSREQHLQSFSEIVDEIHNNGEGLARLSYLNNDNQRRALLTKPEVVHLQDVSVLINQLRTISVINILLLLITIAGVSRFKQPKPAKKERYMAVIIPTVLFIAVFSLFGFTDVFYYLHTVVFPDNHQWFFYYQESLMSSLMKAPDLFAAIALSLSVIAAGIYMLIYRLLMTKIFSS
ncbi:MULTISPECIES: DUF1461 domain-containing protein [unclassified Colwellia]|uniref:lipoprotein intramolecular transacylase Lit n=1 Tax=unclassified Colwellia TaxID=196834 RepID=UPI0015F6A9D1|nr:MULTISPECIES: DUF1461 domain-containing protein [unclassified Colwellia]MBA6349220.1 DUF1461 domain-containing protein [Colwellia sp. BRX8-9]MBA6383298.1 DUF1461 domain-containing protein [Colwellia sp. BRX10-9]MBA6394495.1 DUF1461 domain-containing protein [Colwellia sp. BRX10-6]